MARIIILSVGLALLAGCGEKPQPTVDQDLVPVVDWLASENNPQPAVSPVQPAYEQPPVVDMIAGLETKLEKNPDDLKGWTLLAQSYAYVGQMSDAKRAVDQAVRLGGDETALQAKIVSAHTGVIR